MSVENNAELSLLTDFKSSLHRLDIAGHNECVTKINEQMGNADCLQ